MASLQIFRFLITSGAAGVETSAERDPLGGVRLVPAQGQPVEDAFTVQRDRKPVAVQDNNEEILFSQHGWLFLGPFPRAPHHDFLFGRQEPDPEALLALVACLAQVEHEAGVRVRNRLEIHFATEIKAVPEIRRTVPVELSVLGHPAAAVVGQAGPRAYARPGPVVAVRF